MTVQTPSDPSSGRVTVARFRDLVAAYGANSARWPEAERDAARALIAASAEARDIVARAERLDTALAALPADVPDAALSRLMAATAFPPSRRSTRALAAGFDWRGMMAGVLWPRAAGLAAIAVLGIVVGLASEPVYSNSDDGYLVISELSADNIEDLLP